MKILGIIFLLSLCMSCESHHKDPPPEPIDLARPGNPGKIECPPEGNASRVK